MSDTYCGICHNGAFVGGDPDKCEVCGRKRPEDPITDPDDIHAPETDAAWEILKMSGTPYSYMAEAMMEKCAYMENECIRLITLLNAMIEKRNSLCEAVEHMCLILGPSTITDALTACAAKNGPNSDVNP